MHIKIAFSKNNIWRNINKSSMQSKVFCDLYFYLWDTMQYQLFSITFGYLQPVLYYAPC